MFTRLVFRFLILAALTRIASAGQDRSGACLECHRRQASKVKYIKHNLAEFEKSPHAASGVGCADCHGGDPGEKDPGLAHQGVPRSTQKDSLVYFQNLPQTCGQCHSAELEAFKKSQHYRLLEKKGKGPTCTTCHGAMSATVLKPSGIEQTCSLCHQRPYGAAAVLTIMNQSRELLKAADEGLKEAPAGAAQTAALKLRLKECRARLDDVVLEWHTFDLDRVKKEVNAVFQQARQAGQDVKKIRQDQGGTP